MLINRIRMHCIIIKMPTLLLGISPVLGADDLFYRATLVVYWGLGFFGLVLGTASPSRLVGQERGTEEIF